MRFAIPVVPLREFDEVFATNELGPTHRSEVLFIGGGNDVPNGTTDAEAWVLAALAKRALRMFEFGTSTGKTTYLWARNSPPDAGVVTITLAPDQTQSYVAGSDDDPMATKTALRESAFTRFLYTDTEVEHKVTQIFGDSKEFDENTYAKSCDLIFIDGSHAYSYVKSDTEKALRMLRDGGIILWHDYRGPRGATRGVYTFLNELHERLPLKHLHGTSIVAYRAPSTGEDSRGSRSSPRT